MSLLKNWASPGLFFILVFSIQLDQQSIGIIQLIVNKIGDDWIRTTDLWNRKRQLYQLCHSHCHQMSLFATNINRLFKSENVFQVLYFHHHFQFFKLAQFFPILCWNHFEFRTSFSLFFLFLCHRQIFANEI